MDKFEQLLKRCKCGITIQINDHKNIYATAESLLNDLEQLGFEVDQEIKAKIIETDNLIDIQFYPDTPVGFYKIVHYSWDLALNQALSAIEEGNKNAI